MDGLGSSLPEPYDAPDNHQPASAVPSFTFTEKLRLATEPESLSAESLRSLRAVLLAQHLQDGKRALVLCSPAPGAGSSFLAANLAVAMAQVGINTLLVDGNLRQPAIQDYIAPSQPMAGLSECLCDDTLPLSNVIHPIQPSLSVLYAGTPTAEALDHVGGTVFKSILNSCIRDYDFTIVDAPAANRFADARRIASVTRYALVVVRRGHTYLKDVRTLLTELENARAMPIGTYLNDY